MTIVDPDRQIPRPHLLDALDAVWSHQLTLVSAPAGFGKTEAVRAWLARRAARSAWAALGPGDADPRRFWLSLAGAIDTLWPGAGARVRALLVAPEPPTPEAVAALLLDGLAGHPEGPMAPAVLVLDDYHVVADPRSHGSLRLLLERLPPWLHLVLITRHDPPLPLARMRAHGSLGELRAAELRLRPDEAAALLRRLSGRELSDELSMALHARTEGWAAALQLAAISLRRHDDPATFVRAFTGSHRHVVGYLMEEVFERLPATDQAFLLRTAILDRLCGPLCDALLGADVGGSVGSGADSGATVAGGDRVCLPASRTLQELERQNLFLEPLDQAGCWYRYHRLFAEMLRQQLERRDPALLPALHRCAAGWLEGEGDLDAAFAHLRAAGDLPALAAFVERHGRALIGRSRTVQLRMWLDQLPAELIAARPLLTICAAWLQLLSGRAPIAAQLLGQMPPLPAVAAPRVAGELAALRCALARYGGDIAAALRWSEQARAALPADHGLLAGVALNEGLAWLGAGDEAAAAERLTAAVAAAGPGGGAYAGLMALHALARLALRQGRPTQALALCERGELLAATWGAATLPALGALLVCAAEAHAARDDRAAADAALARGEALLAGTIELGPTARAAALRARLAPGRPSLAALVAPIDRAGAWLDTLGAAAPHTRALLAAQRARLALAHSAYAAAQIWADTCALADDPEVAALQRLVRAQVALAAASAQGTAVDVGSVAAELDALIDTLTRRGWVLLLAEGLLIRAAAALAQGQGAQAAAALGRALALAAPEQLLRPLEDGAAGLGLRPALAALHATWAGQPGRHAQRELASRLLDRLPADAPAPACAALAPPLAEPLSPREQEILELIAAGLSNQAIADRLIVALNTVKWYSSEIYAKLGVRSRTQALIRARELGLLA